MSKNKTVATTTEEMPLANPQGKTVEELKEIAQNLQIQMNQEQTLMKQVQATIQTQQNQFQTHQTKLLKMQGLMEGLLQMIPREEVEEMIKTEESSNHKMDEQVKSST